MARDNYLRETSLFIKEFKNALEKKETESIKQKQKEKNIFVNEYYNKINSRYENDRKKTTLMEAAKNNALSTILKGIYISALEANTLLDENLVLAETLVENYIKEKGGASAIIAETRNKTYLLNRIASIVEDAAKDDVENIEKIDKDDEDINSDDNKNSEENKSNSLKKDENDNSDDNKSDSSKKEKSIEFVDNKEDNGSEPKTDDINSNSEETNDNKDDEDISIEDAPDDRVEPEKSIDNKILIDLDKEEDVQKAVELIRNRIADAEETFIKNNAEDKKKIDELLGKISDNIKTVEDMNNSDSAESKIAQESASINRRRIKNITANRPLSVFEKMTRTLSCNMMKNNSNKKNYLEENNKLDFVSVIEASKVMYGFLETINTLQLEKVDCNYIVNILDNMD